MLFSWNLNLDLNLYTNNYLFLLIAEKYTRPGAKKVAVPLHHEKPIMGLVSDKNFIVSNAVENILAAPKLPSNNTMFWFIEIKIY